MRPVLAALSLLLLASPALAQSPGPWDPFRTYFRADGGEVFLSNVRSAGPAAPSSGWDAEDRAELWLLDAVGGPTRLLHTIDGTATLPSLHLGIFGPNVPFDFALYWPRFGAWDWYLNAVPSLPGALARGTLYDGVGFLDSTGTHQVRAASVSFDVVGANAHVTPEPLSMALLGTGLAGVAAARKRKRV